MTPIDRRLVRLERAAATAPDSFVPLPDDARNGAAALDAATRAAIAEHQRRTGYTGPVLVGPVPCTTEAEWIQKYGRDAG